MYLGCELIAKFFFGYTIDQTGIRRITDGLFVCVCLYFFRRSYLYLIVKVNVQKSIFRFLMTSSGYNFGSVSCCYQLILLLISVEMLHGFYQRVTISYRLIGTQQSLGVSPNLSQPE